MAIAIDPDDRVTHVLECERGLPHEQQTEFYLGPWSIRDEAWIGEVASAGTAERDIVELMRRVLACSLKGWARFKRRDGTDAPFETDEAGRASDLSLSRIGPRARGELFGAAWKLSRLSQDDVGKSEP